MEFRKIIACICEGAAETAIMDVLLDNGCLKFERSDLIDGSLLARTSVRQFETRYLRLDTAEKVTVLRIHDSRRERFRLGTLYKDKVRVYNVITAPEIEVLIIIAEGAYKHFLKKKMKPSKYCKDILGIKDVKSYEYVQEYFRDVDKLVNALREYKRLKRIKKNEYTLLDLIKE